MNTIRDNRLPKVQTRKEFMDYMEEAVAMPREDEEEPRGRPRELKAYMLESEGGFPAKFSSGDITGEVESTGLDGIKILRTHRGEESFEFFLDTIDPRFFILHTNERSEDAGQIVRTLTGDLRYNFDSAWFHSNMLYDFTKKNGNTFKGFGVKYADIFLSDDGNGDNSIDDLRIAINGSLAHDVLDIVNRESRVNRTIAFDKVRIQRGQDSQYNYIQDDVTHEGYFSVKRGKSVQDHLQLVDVCREAYSKTVEHIEDASIGVKTVDERTAVEGVSFDFEFKNAIGDLDRFIERVFNATEPFKLWGLKTKIRDGYYKITATDLHAGTVINFDIADSLMRAYLFKGSCGNTIMRLLTNLQIYHDSKVVCKQVVM